MEKLMTYHPGIYQIPEEIYFAQQAVSNSLLKHMDKSPAHGLAYQNRAYEKPTPAQKLGKLIHKAILEPSRIKGIPVKPKGLNLSTKAGIEWKTALAGADYITTDEYEMLLGIGKSILSHKDAAALLKSKGKVEHSLFAIDEETKLPLKARIDWLSDSNFLLDIKSTVTASPDQHGFVKQMALMRYHVQAAFYLDMCARLEVPVQAFTFVAVEKEPPYAVTLIQLDDLSITKGREEYRRLLNLYKKCQDEGHWPAYSDKIELVSLPDWALRKQPYESAVAYQLETT
jgi:exodeoxyribonuclease VIII